MTLIHGITYTHEHTTIDLSSLKKDDDTNLNCYDETVKEYTKLYEKGVRNIIDVTVMGMKRNPLYVNRVAKESGINIVQSTGWYQDKFFPTYINTASIEDLAEIMLNEICEGIEDTGIKAEVIGEIGTSENNMTKNEKKVFTASALVQKETGVPITTHTTLGTYGKEQVEFFKEMDVNLERVVIGHVDLNGNGQYVIDLLNQGVYVEFDTIGKENYMPDKIRLDMLKEIEKVGYVDKVFLSMDITRKSHLEYKNGLGYCYLLDTFIPYLQENGISDSFIEKMLITNPQTFFK